MLTDLAWLALEVFSIGRAREFYETRLDLDPATRSEQAVAYRAGEQALVLRAPGPVPRGGLHVHYAFETSPGAYGEWAERLAPLDPDEADFGTYRSLYVDDPDDHCVEVGGREAAGEGSDLAGIFEVVLEVESIERALPAYEALGFETLDRGSDRPRVRLGGPFDLELWEPHLGLADARAGVHVHLGLVTEDPEAAAEAHLEASPEARRIDPAGERAAHENRFLTGLRGESDTVVHLRDRDGHWLTFVEGSENRP